MEKNFKNSDLHETAENENIFSPADILLPDFSKVDGEKWAVIACDQFTSEPEYWNEVEKNVGDAPSTLRLMLPEIYLSDAPEARTEAVNAEMRRMTESGIFNCYADSMIYLERTQSDGKLRRGIIGKIDLEKYDYNRGSDTPVRATEGTVLERIPPRVAVRRGAELELPHVMILIDDPQGTVIEMTAERAAGFDTAYDFDLMAGGGHVFGRFIDERTVGDILSALNALGDRKLQAEKYGVDKPALTFAVGDGNHSLASAKAAYEEIKAKLGDAAYSHPSRYALCEIVNLHDEALIFEPIYRVMFGVDPDDVAEKLGQFVSAESDDPANNCIYQKIDYISAKRSGSVAFTRAPHNLTVGSLQIFIDGYLKEHPDAKVDYIHGEESVRNLAAKENAIGFIFDGMRKDELFRAVMCEGALPRKTFSMGEARDKRYYLECRRIK